MQPSPARAAQQLHDLLETIASGKQASFEDFVAHHFAPSLIEQQGTPVYWGDRLARLYYDTRRLNVKTVERDEPEHATVLAKAQLTGLWYRLDLALAAGSPKISIFTWQRIRPPAIEPRPTQGSLLDNIRKTMGRLAGADVFSGTFLIAKGDKVVLTGSYGYASDAYKIPNRRSTIFNLASIGKNFTAVAIMQLAEQGKLSLLDKVGKFLPEFPNADVRNKVTIHHLLSHSSGLGDFHGPKFVELKDTLREVKDYLPLIADAKLDFEPGSRMQYSNIGYILLGAIIEKASGENFYSYIRSHIFQPAGMLHTDYYYADIDTPAVATGYTSYADLGGDFQLFTLGLKRTTGRYGTIRGNPQGGSYSTVDDLFRYSQALRSGRLVSPKTLDQMSSNKYFFRQYGAEQVFYGYGFELENVDGQRVIGHGGGDLGISAVVRWYPDSGNYTVVILSNTDRGAIIAIDKVQESILLAASLAPPGARRHGLRPRVR